MAEIVTNSEEKLEQLIDKKAKIERRINEEKSRLSQANRKKRTQKLIQIGGLAEIAGLGNLDKGVMLGALLEIAARIKRNPDQAHAWKQVGDFTLKQREDARTGNRKESDQSR